MLTLRRARLAFKIAAAFARAVPFCNFDAGPVGFFAATGFLTTFGLGLVPVAFLTGLPSLPFAAVFFTTGFLAGAAFFAGAGLAAAGFFAASAFFAGSAFLAAGLAAAGLSVFLAVDEPAAAAAGFLSLSPATM